MHDKITRLSIWCQLRYTGQKIAMGYCRLFHFVLMFSFYSLATCMEPFAMFNAMAQPVWQAGDPIKVNVDFDVPAAGTLDELKELRSASRIEYQVANRNALLSKVVTPIAINPSLRKNKH